MSKGQVTRPEGVDIPPWTTLAKWRKEFGFTQAQLCAGIMSQTQLSQIERGERLPEWSVLEQLSFRLQIPFSEMKGNWEKVFYQGAMSHQLWELVREIESRRQGYNERTRLLNRLYRYVNGSAAPFLDAFCRLSYNGYLAARLKENNEAERNLVESWDVVSYSFLMNTQVRKLKFVHALTRVTLAQNLGRRESAKFWESKLPISLRH